MNTEYILTELFEFLLSMKWLWVIAIFLLLNIVNRLITAYNNSLIIKIEALTKDIDYNEAKIIEHIDYIINEALDQYVLLNITPRNIYYINSKMETKIISHLSDTIPDRLSPALLAKLGLIYNQAYVPKFIGSHIYMIVTSFVLEFNMNQKDQPANNRQQDISNT